MVEEYTSGSTVTAVRAYETASKTGINADNTATDMIDGSTRAYCKASLTVDRTAGSTDAVSIVIQATNDTESTEANKKWHDVAELTDISTGNEGVAYDGASWDYWRVKVKTVGSGNTLTVFLKVSE